MKKQNKYGSNVALIIGITGFSITLIFNLAAYFFTKQPETIPFQSGWWAVWFSSYVVWSGITCLGIVLMLASRKEK